MFERGDLPKKPVRLIGVGISGWPDDQPRQDDLFDRQSVEESERKLLETIDDVAEKFGKGKLQFGVGPR